MEKSFLYFILFVFAFPQAFAENSQHELTTLYVQEKEVVTDLEGFEDLPILKLPLSAIVITQDEMGTKSVRRLSDVTRLDASTTDSYNASGYWDYLAIRGFVLDNRYNFQREGLPILATTSIPLENKEKISVLKGLSGIQSGASSPGGQIHFTVKRPTHQKRQEARVEFSDNGQSLLAMDAGGRMRNSEWGYRVNVAHEELRPLIDDAEGDRNFVSFATDWRMREDLLLEAEIEWSKKSQPTQAGLSLLGDKLPTLDQPKINLNNQSWSQPAQFEALTASVRATKTLSSDWGLVATVGMQELKTDDFLAYPYGCTSEGLWDRYCSDGSFDLYDFRSAGEVRRTYGARVGLQGSYQTGAVHHVTYLGVVGSHTQENFNRQAYNYVGVGRIDGSVHLPENADLLDENTNRESAQYDVLVTEAMSQGAWRTWLGARYSFINRSSVRTDGSRPVSYSESFPVPWAALGYQFDQVLAYVSAGLGVESFVIPNKSGYDYRGENLKDVISRQWELGIKGDQDLKWSVSAFQISRPVVTDKSPSYQVDGEALHRGVEGTLAWQKNAWNLTGSWMILDAKREHSTLAPELNGRKPVNVPDQVARVFAEYSFSRKWSVDSLLSYESSRAVTADNAISISAWARWDGGVSYSAPIADVETTWRLSIQNMRDERYWKESPTQYGHIYLYPGEPRSVWLRLQAAL